MGAFRNLVKDHAMKFEQRMFHDRRWGAESFHEQEKRHAAGKDRRHLGDRRGKAPRKDATALPLISDGDLSFELKECCKDAAGNWIGPAGEPCGAHVGLLLLAAARLDYLVDIQAAFRQATGGYSLEDWSAMQRDIRRKT